ncbi:hypothetical protein [Crateriforma conspicua]|uniref:SHOCT domain-containing protein n=1 Tax=Crateriforma conspicua TaxID=2527996 RepID=A0A5C6FTB7_9PLAN|nr:hypothetical protein [Crateriforma conspicua]TWU64748.1 hypothetical protein V7x_02920 [Crateriforma conspicua]
MQSVGSLLVLAVLIAAGFYLVSIFRDYAANDQETEVDVLANLREMHRKGDISDQEFRKIESITQGQVSGSQPSASSDSDDPSGETSPTSSNQ